MSKASISDDDDDDYEEAEGGNRLLGFMFGNVDDSGDLDADYLDEDAKEHLAALAVELGSSLTDIDLSVKSPRISAEGSEQDYDEKAENAVDYEDIDEQYEGPEIHATSEEDYLLPKKEYFSSEISLPLLEPKISIFDEEDYDEEETYDGDDKVADNDSIDRTISVADKNLEPSIEDEKDLENELHSCGPLDNAKQIIDMLVEDAQDGSQEPLKEKTSSSLPILFVDNGMVVLRFSEIFGVHEPLKKREKRSERYPPPKDRHKSFGGSTILEDDEEVFFRSSCQGLPSSKVVKPTQYCNASLNDTDAEPVMFGEWSGISMQQYEYDEHRKDSCHSAEAMKEGITVDMAAGWGSFSFPEYYPLDREDWEDEIIWDNSPLVTHESFEGRSFSGLEPEHLARRDSELESEQKNISSNVLMEMDEKDHRMFLHSHPVVLESFGSRNFSDQSNYPISEKAHPQLLRLESRVQLDHLNILGGKENDDEHIRTLDAKRSFRKLSSQNMSMLDGSWLEKIIWESNETILSPKLILDLQDEHMLFEILDTKDGRHLCAHAGAMVMTRSVKASAADLLDLPAQGTSSVGRFNISNDKYYSNRKNSQQLKAHSKKRAAHGIKILHSVPALKLQTLKPKLSNKDIANFHRPKALWYPHDNEMAAKEQGKLCSQGPVKIIMKSLGGKGSKLHVNAEETVSSVKAKASKKLDFKPSENVKVFYSGRELQEDKSLAVQNVRPNSLLHLVRTKIHLWPRAQRLPGENKSLRPPGAFKNKAELSVKDGHVFLMEYCEERPLLLGNAGMGARLCTYYQKTSSGDQTASLLRSGNCNLGHILPLDPADKSPFLGDIKPGCSQSSLETNMYRAPIFLHKVSSTDYLLVRSAKGKLSLRRIDRIYVVGQQEPHMEVVSPGTKSLQTYVGNRLLVYIYREFRANEKHGLVPRVRQDELSAQFPNLSEPFLRKRLKHCAELQRGPNGQFFWGMKRSFRIPLEEELRRMVTPENVCAYESMQAGLYRLKRLGISRLTHPSGLSSAMSQLPDEAITLAAASHIERELQITPWNLTSNFVACTSQDRENIERLEITGVGDPSGRGLGFSYVRVAPKGPVSSAVVKKKVATIRGGSTVTGTDADLRRLSMEAAREVLLKFNVPEEQIAKQTRWHRIAMIRKLSSEQAASGVKVDATSISKYARGQRMSFLQLQQQTREKCQDIWDRQVQSLSAADGDENESDSEANSDLDSFAGDLENLLDAEECGEGEEGDYESRNDKANGLKGIKMWRRPNQAQAEEEIEDEAAEAAELCRMLMDDDEIERRKKKKEPGSFEFLGLNGQSCFRSEIAEPTTKTKKFVKRIIRTARPNGSMTSNEQIIGDPMEVGNILAKKALSKNGKLKKGNKQNEIPQAGLLEKKSKAMGDGSKVIKEKKQTDKPVRENFVCGACGQRGHMKTNKNCPSSGKQNSFDASAQLQQRTIKKFISKGPNKIAQVETTENIDIASSSSKRKILPVKVKVPERTAPRESQIHEENVPVDAETGVRSAGKINRLIFTNKVKPEDVQVEQPNPSFANRPPAETSLGQSLKRVIIKQPKSITIIPQVQEEIYYDAHEEYRKTKRMSELSNSEKNRKQESKRLADGATKRRAEEEVQGRVEREERDRSFRVERRLQAAQHMIDSNRRYKEDWRDEEMGRQKVKKKKRPKPMDDYSDERSFRNDRRMPERDRAAKRRSGADMGKYLEDYTPQPKRRRGDAGEVGLANILENIVDTLKDTTEVSYLFLKPVSKKEAPDYLDIIKQPMDLSTIKEKARGMQYKSREEFRHDMFLITYNAHKYNDPVNSGMCRNHRIPPIADQLLELCDYMLCQNEERLNEAEAGIESNT
ncbi:hypothetical protein Syun_003383 [Stephania yunnanensis]|uniref:Transcription initiation factor TFIID subunit 1 n=1 Tax=Stephania yunnanensis TaxID=152371 RepID=A0AAP0L1B7_9MAGN